MKSNENLKLETKSIVYEGDHKNDKIHYEVIIQNFQNSNKTGLILIFNDLSEFDKA